MYLSSILTIIAVPIQFKSLMLKYSFSEIYYFSEAFFFICVGKLMIKIMPFHKISKILGKQGDSSSIAPIDDLPKKVALAVKRAAGYVFFRSVCYDQAIAGKLMLKLRGTASTLYFGTAKDEDNKLIAHAWLKCGTFFVTGERGMDRFTVVGIFGD